MENNFSDNASQHRFELKVGREIAFADYRKDDGNLHIVHVEAPLALRGTGSASKLMQEIFDTAKLQHLNIVPICGYAASWLRQHSPS